MDKKRALPLIGIVGVCASGKSTLIATLTSLGYNCRHIAQEHSFVPDMWKKLTNPDILIYLEVSYENTLRRKNMQWSRQEYEEQLFRIRDAVRNADFTIHTDNISPDQVLQEVLKRLPETNSMVH